MDAGGHRKFHLSGLRRRRVLGAQQGPCPRGPRDSCNRAVRSRQLDSHDDPCPVVLVDGDAVHGRRLPAVPKQTADLRRHRSPRRWPRRVREPLERLDPGPHDPESQTYEIQDADWYGNRLWVSQHVGCTPAGDTAQRSCLRLLQFNTAGKYSVAQQTEFGAAGKYCFDPAMTTDGQGNLEVVFGSSSPTEYPSV